MINLICSRNLTRFVNVIFLIDGGSPNTFLSYKAMKAIAPECEVLQAMHIYIHTPSAVTICNLSRGHFEEINILGTDFFKKLRLKTVINYSKDTVTIFETGKVI